MSRVSLPERVWWDSSVPVYIDKVLLPLGLTLLGVLVWVNPMNFDWQQRTSLGIAVLAFLYFLSHTLHLRNEAIRLGSTASLVAATHVADNSEGKPETDKATPPVASAQREQRAPEAKPQPNRPTHKEDKPAAAEPSTSITKTEGDEHVPEHRPSQTAQTIINQDNRNSSGTNVGQVNVYNRPVEFTLTSEQQAAARQILDASPAKVRLILPSPNPMMASPGQTTELAAQIRGLFSAWLVDASILGMAPVSPGVTVVGDSSKESLKVIVRAFSAANIPYTITPSGYTGPMSLGVPEVAVTISRNVER